MTDSTMVERVAEALIVVLGGLSQGTSASTLEKIDQLGGGEIYDVWIEPEGIRTLARAAIEAIGPELRACIAYFDGYAQDEADDEENCVAGTYQHASAQAFRDAVTGFRASLSKGEE